MQATRNARIKSLQTMRNVITEKSSPTTATSSGQDIQAHVCQSDGHITATIRPEYEANVGPTKAVQPPPRPIRRPCTPPPRPARHLMIPTATRPPHQGRASPPAPSHSVRDVGSRGRTTEWVGATRWCGAQPADPRQRGQRGPLHRRSTGWDVIASTSAESQRVLCPSGPFVHHSPPASADCWTSSIALPPASAGCPSALSWGGPAGTVLSSCRVCLVHHDGTRSRRERAVHDHFRGDPGRVRRGGKGGGVDAGGGS